MLLEINSKTVTVEIYCFEQGLNLRYSGNQNIVVFELYREKLETSRKIHVRTNEKESDSFVFLWLFRFDIVVFDPKKFKQVIAKQLLFIRRKPKLYPILQLVLAPLIPVPIEKQFRWSYPPSEYSNLTTPAK